MNEAALMRALAKRFGEDEDGKPAKPQCPEAEAHDLRVRYRKLQEKHEFNPGDLVRIKPEVGGYNHDGPSIVVTTDRQEAVAIHGKRKPISAGAQIIVVDMIVAQMSLDGKYIVEHAVDSRRFEPWPYPVEDQRHHCRCLSAADMTLRPQGPHRNNQRPASRAKWYSRKMHDVLRTFRFCDGIKPSLLILPDGKIATAQSQDENHGLMWDDVVFVGEYDTCAGSPASSVSIADKVIEA